MPGVLPSFTRVKARALPRLRVAPLRLALQAHRPELIELLEQAEGAQNGSPKASGRPGVNTAIMWKFATTSLYASGDLPVLCARECLQNGIDAIRAAVRARQLKAGTGVFSITWDLIGRTLTLEDNGIGMSTDVILEKFLVLGESGKRDGEAAGSNAGGFGMAKAVILGASSTFRWELHTRDNRAISTGLHQEISIFDAPQREGTLLTLHDIDPQFDHWFVPGEGEVSLLERLRELLAATEAPGVTLMLNGITVPYRWRGKRSALVKVDADWGGGTEARVISYRRSDMGGAYFVRLDGLYQFKRAAARGRLSADVIIDLTPQVRPGEPGYPLNAARDGLVGVAHNTLYFLTKRVEQESESIGKKHEDEVLEAEAATEADDALCARLLELAQRISDPKLQEHARLLCLGRQPAADSSASDARDPGAQADGESDPTDYGTPTSGATGTYQSGSSEFPFAVFTVGQGTTPTIQARAVSIDNGMVRGFRAPFSSVVWLIDLLEEDEAIFGLALPSLALLHRSQHLKNLALEDGEPEALMADIRISLARLTDPQKPAASSHGEAPIIGLNPGSSAAKALGIEYVLHKLEQAGISRDEWEWGKPTPGEAIVSVLKLADSKGYHFPAQLWDALDAWFHGEASNRQLELIVRSALSAKHFQRGAAPKRRWPSFQSADGSFPVARHRFIVDPSLTALHIPGFPPGFDRKSFLKAWLGAAAPHLSYGRDSDELLEYHTQLLDMLAGWPPSEDGKYSLLSTHHLLYLIDAARQIFAAIEELMEAGAVHPAQMPQPPKPPPRPPQQDQRAEPGAAPRVAVHVRTARRTPGSNPFGRIPIRVSKDFDRELARKFKRNPRKWMPYALLWDLSLSLVASALRLESPVKSGFILDDSVEALTSKPEGAGTATIYIHPFRFEDVVERGRDEPIGIASYLHHLAVHELTHVDRMGDGHDEGYVANREANGHQSAHLLPRLVTLVREILELPAPRHPAEVELANTQKELAKTHKRIERSSELSAQKRADLERTVRTLRQQVTRCEQALKDAAEWAQPMPDSVSVPPGIPASVSIPKGIHAPAETLHPKAIRVFQRVVYAMRAQGSVEQAPQIEAILERLPPPLLRQVSDALRRRDEGVEQLPTISRTPWDSRDAPSQRRSSPPVTGVSRGVRFSAGHQTWSEQR